MATVIDSLIIELSLDPSNFTKGQKQAADSFLKTRDAAVKAGAQVENSAKNMAEALSKTTANALELFAVFLGGRGLKEFVADSVQANASLGRLSGNLQVSPQLLSAWGMAAERMGGSAQAAVGSIQGLSDMLQALQKQGEAPPPALFQMFAKVGQNFDTTKSTEEQLISIAGVLHQIAQTDPVGANFWGRRIGLDPSLVNVLIHHGGEMRKYLEDLKRLAPSDRDIGQAEKLQDRWKALGNDASFLGTKIATALGPALEFLADKLGAVLEAVAHWVELNPGWTQAIGAAVILLTGAKFVQMIRNLLLLKDALLGVSAANAAGGAGGLLALLGRAIPLLAVAIGMADVYEHSSAGGGEDQIMRERVKNLAKDPDYYKPGHPGNLDHPGNGGQGAGAGWQQADIQKLMGMGWSREQAAGIVANVQGESAGRPDSVGDSGQAYGLANWHPDRQANFARWAGHDIRQSTHDEQLAFINYELRQGSEQAAGAALSRATDAATAAALVTRLYERPRNPDADALMRGNTAAALYQGSLAAGAPRTAALSNIANDNRATTSTSSNEMHIGSISVNAPQATDAGGIAGHIDSALAASAFANFANYGPN